MAPATVHPVQFEPLQIDPPRFFTNSEGDENLPSRWFELYYNGKTLKYTVEVFGEQEQPSSGFPLYIGLHGGGSGPLSDNDSAWKDVAERFYHDPIADYHKGPNESAVLVCPRGISSIDSEGNPVDTWDLHFQPEACVLLEAMIVNLLKPFPSNLDLEGYLAEYPELSQYPVSDAAGGVFVDPNRVYLWGFSAGGDGAFRLGTKIPDRFAAVIAAAGHPGETRFANAANVPMLLEVGEDDCYPRPANLYQPIEWQRAKVYLESAQKALYELGHALSEADKGAYYQYACYVVQNACRDDPSPDTPHGYWSQPGTISTEQQVLSPGQEDNTEGVSNFTNFNKWLKQYAQVQPPPARFTSICATYESKVINPITDPLVQGVERRATPGMVIWDLDWRADQLDPTTQGRFFYWLYLRAPYDVQQLDPASWTIKARIDGGDATNSLRILTPNVYVGYMLKELWLWKRISVYIGEDTAPIWTGSVRRRPEIEKQTLNARGDPNLQFSAMLYLEETDDGVWEVKQAESLNPPVPPGPCPCPCPVHRALANIGIEGLMKHQTLVNGVSPELGKKLRHG